MASFSSQYFGLG